MSSIVKVDTIQENTSANGITVDGLNIKDSKLVTANSVVASNITADAIDATKIADNAISEEHLDVTAITGHTAETSIADGDTLLIHDASASALRKMTKANFVSGLGATNAPAFSAAINSNQSISNNTATTVAYANELFDTGSDYNNSTYKWTVPETGKYLINVRMAFDSSADFFSSFQIVKDGVGDMFSIQMAHDNTSDTITGSLVLSLSASEVYYIQATQTSGGSLNLIGNHQNSEFSAFKLAGV